MATYAKYDLFVENVANKQIDIFGSTDTFRVVIHTDAPASTTDNSVSDLTQISGNNGYTTGGENITFNSTRSGGTITATAVDVVWTAVTGNLGSSTTGQYFSVYDDTSTGDYLMCSFNYGSTFTVAVGESMTFDVGASLWTFG
jgi:hypothetical protein